MAQFQSYVAVATGERFDSYETLWQWSVNQPARFWRLLWDFFGLTKLFGAPGATLADAAMPGADWFPEASVNFAEYVLSQGEEEDVAIVGTSEPEIDHTPGPSQLSRRELREQVAALAHSLRELGIRPGDRIIGYLPNIPETVVALLATASIGAIWSSVGQDYSAQAAIDRFAQLEPRVLIAADGYRWAGREYRRVEEIDRIRSGLPTLEHTIVVTRFQAEVPAGSLSWRSQLAEPAKPYFQRLPFGHPLWILFSSGTTGLPKGIVHGHGGVLLEELKFIGLHNDIGPADRFFWFTSPSWVMWNILASALGAGASIVCYDGAPSFPDVGTLWKLTAQTRATYFGTSPGYLEQSQKAGIHPADEFDLGALRTLGSSGSPIPPAVHRWAIAASGGHPLFSVSGGTDVASGFCAGSPTVPVYAGEISVRCLGVTMDAWDETGHPVRGEVGEMVVTRPMPSMPLFFWNDPTGERYRDAYFDVYPGVWRHGDWITVTSHSSVIVHGRSDSTLNRHGVRMGSADIYNVVDALPDIADSLVLGVEGTEGDYWMPLFVVAATGYEVDDELRDRIRALIRERVSPRHVPDEIIAVPTLPHTKTGKRLEVPLKRLFQGANPARVVQPTAVDDPAALIMFIELATARLVGGLLNRHPISTAEPETRPARRSIGPR